MSRVIAILIFLSALPFSAHGATLLSGKTLVNTTPLSGNVYETGGDVRVGVEAPADVVLLGGTLTLAAPVKGDALLAGGTIDIQQLVSGDARLLGGRVLIDKGVTGDLMVLAGTLTTLEPVSTMYAAASVIDMRGGALAPVTLYGGTVSLAGEFSGDVNVTVSDKLELAPGTVIHGSLKYNAPQEVSIPTDAKILGKIEYTGSSSFVPSPEEAKNVARAGAGVFLLVKILAALLVVGLVAGLFPVFATHIAEETLWKGTRRFALLFLLGFAILFATPILALILLLSFAGIGVALLLFALYVSVVLLAGIYAGILAGAALARSLFKRTEITWKDALLGTLLLTVVSIIPFIGGLVSFILVVTALGALVRAAYLFAFSHNHAEPL